MCILQDKQQFMITGKIYTIKFIFTKTILTVPVEVHRSSCASYKNVEPHIYLHLSLVEWQLLQVVFDALLPCGMLSSMIVFTGVCNLNN